MKILQIQFLNSFCLKKSLQYNSHKGISLSQPPKIYVFDQVFQLYKLWNILNNRQLIQILMKNLAYIPTKQDKDQLKALILKQQISQQNNRYQRIDDQILEENVEKRKLTPQQLNKLLNKLTKITKRQYDIQQQTTYILKVNQELKKKRVQGQKVENRLLALGKQREKKIEELTQQLQRQQKQKFYRQVPQICEKSQKLKQRGIDRRLQDLIQERVNRKEELIQKYQPIFHPTVDPQSQFINEIQNLGDLFNRMDVKQKQAEKRKISITKQIKNQQEKVLTFKPIINQKSRQIAEKLPPKLIPGTPYQRVQSIQEEVQIFQFIPTINKNTELLLHRRQNDKNCFRRLYQNAKQLQAKNQLKKNERDRALSFQPTLNTKSLKIAHSRCTDNKTKNDGSNINQDQFIEEIKIGNERQNFKQKSYSLRFSAQNKQKREWDMETNRQNRVISNFNTMFS